MNPLRTIIIAIAVVSQAACMTAVTLAPGAEQVRITRVPADVQACVSVGNLSVSERAIVPFDSARNQAVGLGGDTILDTAPIDPLIGSQASLSAGVVYCCRK